jgi:23S rRNA (guanine745-N1)-methyltransferase
MGYLRCPVCKNELKENIDSFTCAKGHRFDRASQGYANLTIGSKRRKSGDEKAMIAARSHFLAQGYYLPLRERLMECLRSFPFTDALDLGCGEGYYTNALADAFPASKWTGIDLSVDALKSAAKHQRTVRYLVASIHDLPIFDESIDLVLNVFAPLFKDEIRRVLRPGGYAVLVLPGESHLLELKEHLYSTIKLNPSPVSTIEGFETISMQDLEFFFEVRTNADLRALLQMTPYVHRSPQKSVKEVQSMDAMRIRASFRILCVKKPHINDNIE